MSVRQIAKQQQLLYCLVLFWAFPQLVRTLNVQLSPLHPMFDDFSKRWLSTQSKSVKRRRAYLPTANDWYVDGSALWQFKAPNWRNEQWRYAMCNSRRVEYSRNEMYVKKSCVVLKRHQPCRTFGVCIGTQTRYSANIVWENRCVADAGLNGNCLNLDDGWTKRCFNFSILLN